MKLVIGTRRWLGPDWTHIDADSTPLTDEEGHHHPVDLVCDARHINLPNGCAAVVYSQEMIEHVPWADYRLYLREWARLVGPGGKLIVETPDFLAACRQVLEIDTLEMDRAIQQIIFGGQANKYDFHMVGLTPRMLTEDFENLGLRIVNIGRGWEVGYLRVEGER
jgi:predicted SAM-dependent methyltransferase